MRRDNDGSKVNKREKGMTMMETMGDGEVWKKV